MRGILVRLLTSERGGRRHAGRALGVAVALVVLMGGLSAAAPSSRAGARGLGDSTSAPPAIPDLAVVSTQPSQTISGFGASGAWWPRDAKFFPAATRHEIGRLLFSPKGIDLSTYRFYIGGGGVGVDQATPGESETGSYDRAQPGFYLGSGLYDWANEQGEQEFLRMAAAYHVPNLVAMSYSAPPQWTTDGRNCGGSIVPADIGKYAAYLTKVVDHFHEEGINFSYVSAMNEPADAFGSISGCAQEGMVVPVSERGDLVKALGEDLASSAPYARVIAPDDVSTSRFVQTVPEWISQPDVAKYVAALTYHGYNFPGPVEDRAVAGVGKEFGKPTWMTEICCEVTTTGGYGAQYNPTMSSGMWLATFIYQALRYSHDSSFQWWVALSAAMGCDPATDPGCATRVRINTDTYNDGLIYYDPNYAKDKNYTLYPTKRLWVLGNYSRFVRPGAVTYDVTTSVPHVELLAFRARHGDWSIIAIDTAPKGSSSQAVNLELPCSAGQLRPAGAWRTSATDNLAPVNSASVSGDLAQIDLAPQSVTSYLLDSSAGPVPPSGLPAPPAPAQHGSPAVLSTVPAACAFAGGTLTLTPQQTILGSGAPVDVVAELHNSSSTTLSNAGFSLSGPAGVTVEPSESSLVPPGPSSIGPGGNEQETFSVTGSAGVEPGSVELTGQADFTGGSDPMESAVTATTSLTVPYDSFQSAYDNTGITSNTDVQPHPDLLGMDGHGTTYSAQGLAANGVMPGGQVDAKGLSFTWPDVAAGAKDNVMTAGQVIQMSGSGSTLGFLGAADNGALSGSGEVVYTDGSVQKFTIDIGNFWYPAGQDWNPDNTEVASSFANYPTGTSEGTSYQHTVYVFATTVPIDPSKTVRYVVLPDTNGGTVAGYTAVIHLFDVTIGT